MEETLELKRANFIGYRLDKGIYYLVDFKTDKILDSMCEVAVLYDGDIMLKHGSPDLILPRLKILSAAYKLANIENDLHIIQGKFPVEELDKILTIAGYKPDLNGL